MKVTYYAIIYKHPDDIDYTVIFPEIPHAITLGTSIKNAMYMAQDYLETYFEGYGFDDLIPTQSAEKILSEFKANPDNEYDKIDMVGILPITAYVKEKSKRLNITLPQSVIHALDTKIGKGKKARFIADCITKEIQSL